MNFLIFIIYAIIITEVVEYDRSMLHTALIMCANMFLFGVVDTTFDLTATELNYAKILLACVIVFCAYNLIHLYSCKDNRVDSDEWL